MWVSITTQVFCIRSLSISCALRNPHTVIVAARKSADDTQTTLRILLERGCKELINEPDSLGNTPLHALIVRYALEEARYGYDRWNKYEVLSLVRFLLQNGAKSSINQAGNSALACVFRHIRDWEMCYELLSMMMKEGGDPNMVGRDGSVPIMVCLVPLINKDQLHHYTHSMKVCFVNCIRILLLHGANPNCSYRCKLTPLHVLIFTVSENFTLNCDVQKRQNFEFIKDILLLLLQHGLDCNQTYRHVLQSVMDMVQNVRTSKDMLRIYELAKTLIQYGADPNELLNQRDTSGSAIVVSEIANYGDRLRGDGGGGGGGGGVVGVGSGTAPTLRGSFRTHSRHILFYYIVLITKKDFLLSETPLTYPKIIYLLYYSMDHVPLYNCLKSLHDFYMAQVPNRLTDQLISVITTLYRKPRTLKQMCRHRIYHSLSNRVALNVGKLSLPGPLRDYLLNFEE